MKLGVSDFAKKQHHPESGNSFTTLSDNDLVKVVLSNWEHAIPGHGETDLSRKILVPIVNKWNFDVSDTKQGSVDPLNFFFLPPKMPLILGMPLQCKVEARQEGEAPYIQKFIHRDNAIQLGFEHKKANKVQVVCYSAEALLENNGTRSTDCEWEVVCLLCSSSEIEPMTPLTMARNYLEKEGGTFTEYSAQQFAESIWYWSTQSGVRIIGS